MASFKYDRGVPYSAWRSRVCRAQVAMEDEITKAGLQNVPGFHKKVIQMFDIFNIRFGADSVC